MNNEDIKIALSLKDSFQVKRHMEHVDLAKLRHKLSLKVIEIRDKIATKRHQERIKILKGL